MYDYKTSVLILQIYTIVFQSPARMIAKCQTADKGLLVIVTNGLV